MLTPFTATKLTHALGTIDNFAFVTGATGNVSDYDSSSLGERHVIASYSQTLRRKHYFATQHYFGRNARRDALNWLERMAAA